MPKLSQLFTVNRPSPSVWVDYYPIDFTPLRTINHSVLAAEYFIPHNTNSQCSLLFFFTGVFQDFWNQN